MKYILEKSAVLSFVALKIIVFSALIFVITGCQMSEEELNAIIDERVAEKTIQIETALTDWASDEIARQVKEIPTIQGPTGPRGPMGYSGWSPSRLNDLDDGDRVGSLEFELSRLSINLNSDIEEIKEDAENRYWSNNSSFIDIEDRLADIESDIDWVELDNRIYWLEKCLETFAKLDTAYEGHTHYAIPHYCP